MRFFLLFNLVCSFAVGSVELPSQCRDHVKRAQLLKEVAHLKIPELFVSTEPWTVPTPSGERLPLTMAIDAEIVDKELGELLLGSPLGVELVKNAFYIQGDAALFDPLELANIFRYLKPDAPFLKMDFQTLSQSYVKTVARIIQPMFRSPMQVDIDTPDKIKKIHPLEIRHRTCVLSPIEFALDYEVMNKLSPRGVHIHLGLPVRAISGKIGIQIARFLEVYVTLRKAKLAEYGEPERFIHGSPLAGMPGRGFISFQANRWDFPHPAHDLQIRSDTRYLATGWDLLGGAMGLALGAQIIKPIEGKFGLKHGIYLPDPFLGNIKGALEYIHVLLSRDRSYRNSPIRSDAKGLAEAWRPNLPADSPFYNDLRGYLERSNIINIIEDPRFITKHES
jgi:hypothetical protein